MRFVFCGMVALRDRFILNSKIDLYIVYESAATETFQISLHASLYIPLNASESIQNMISSFVTILLQFSFMRVQAEYLN
jgi:hypothetical protein